LTEAFAIERKEILSKEADGSKYRGGLFCAEDQADFGIRRSKEEIGRGMLV